MHGTGYASLFLNPCASVYTQLGQSCSAATRLSLHIPPEQVVVDAAQQKLMTMARQHTEGPEPALSPALALVRGIGGQHIIYLLSNNSTSTTSSAAS